MSFVVDPHAEPRHHNYSVYGSVVSNLRRFKTLKLDEYPLERIMHLILRFSLHSYGGLPGSRYHATPPIYRKVTC